MEGEKHHGHGAHTLIIGLLILIIVLLLFYCGSAENFTVSPSSNVYRVQGGLLGSVGSFPDVSGVESGMLFQYFRTSSGNIVRAPAYTVVFTPVNATRKPLVLYGSSTDGTYVTLHDAQGIYAMRPIQEGAATVLLFSRMVHGKLVNAKFYLGML